MTKSKTQPTPTKQPEQDRRLELTQAQLDKIAADRAIVEKQDVDPEWLAIAEFGKFYGWGGVNAILQNEITGEEMIQLLKGARKLEAKDKASAARAAFIGAVSAQTKKPGETFKKLSKPYEDAAK